MNGTDAPVTLVDLINRLVEPPMPEPISLVPQTAGWYVLGALLLSGLAYGLWRLWLYWRANAYRRAARVALDRAGDDPAEIAAILRRAALAAYPRRRVAGLAGADWVAFLHDTGGFPMDAGRALIRAPYAPGTDATALRQGAAQWLRSHRGAP
jgi:hypothetical protein